MGQVASDIKPVGDVGYQIDPSLSQEDQKKVAESFTKNEKNIRENVEGDYNKTKMRLQDENKRIDPIGAWLGQYDDGSSNPNSPLGNLINIIEVVAVGVVVLVGVNVASSATNVVKNTRG
jgi:hypothetical protein